MNVTPDIVSALLGVSKGNAKKMIGRVHYKNGEYGDISEHDLSRGWDNGIEGLKPLMVGAEEFDKVWGTQLEFAMNNFHKNFGKPGPLWGYIMNFPLKKLEGGKSIPSVIRLPKEISALLTEEQKERIVSEWTSRYAHYSIKHEINYVA